MCDLYYKNTKTYLYQFFKLKKKKTISCLSFGQFISKNKNNILIIMLGIILFYINL